MVRPGGTVAIFDADYASLTFGCSDPALGQAMENALQATIMSSPRVMRELPRLLQKAGLRLIATQAHVYAEAGSSSFMLGLAETYAPLAASTGLLPSAEVDAWLADQRRSSEEGTFFGACNYYASVARRGHPTRPAASSIRKRAPSAPSRRTRERRRRYRLST